MYQDVHAPTTQAAKRQGKRKRKTRPRLSSRREPVTRQTSRSTTIDVDSCGCVRPEGSP
eukprot:CAMPEP_0206167080 /NCGR_PEP_ID=MMETSP1474-20131121/26663_1 /ASSEMBLY_ACC=CAM_ASM_001110 /TAXON_ID=97495 /ORGANISM="Imantonia sp., Strain RCC918" /LENGTH=58 /DNA_ID=CAMNT_0053571503 /DNA_START=88 /DNA_END=261 /DNA_ORIENTATION=-